MILHLLRMRRNVNRNVFKDRNNGRILFASPTSPPSPTSPKIPILFDAERSCDLSALKREALFLTRRGHMTSPRQEEWEFSERSERTERTERSERQIEYAQCKRDNATGCERHTTIKIAARDPTSN